MNVAHVTIDRNQGGIFNNTMAVGGFIRNSLRKEHDLQNYGMDFITARNEGNPVSAEEKLWIIQLCNESYKKAKYMMINDLYDFIPERLKNAKLFYEEVR